MNEQRGWPSERRDWVSGHGGWAARTGERVEEYVIRSRRIGMCEAEEEEGRTMRSRLRRAGICSRRRGL